MLCIEETNAVIDYKTRTVGMGSYKLPIIDSNGYDDLLITNLGVKTVQRIIER